MEFSYQIGWQHNSSNPVCDENAVNSGQLIRSDDLICLKGCHSWYPGLTLDYFCKDFSLTENWSLGEHSKTFNFTGNHAVVAYSGCCWVEPFNAEWFVVTVNTLSRRNDTGKINSTPKSSMTPLLKVKENCNHTISLLVSDFDEDIVRCRWAQGYEECGFVCNRFPNAVLDNDSCTITYEAKYGKGPFIAAIMIEDFLPYTKNPLSSVSLQFIVEVYSSDGQCIDLPHFIPPTYTSKSCIAIPPNTAFSTQLLARSGKIGASISEIRTESPTGLTVSALQNSDDLDAFYVDILWQPAEDQLGEIHSFCYTPVDSLENIGEQICIGLMPGAHPPSISSFSVSHINSNIYTINLEFDQPIQYPLTSANITFRNYDTDRVLYSIDVLQSTEISLQSHDLSIVPNFVFPELQKIFIEVDRAIINGQSGCNPGNIESKDKDRWTFVTFDVTPPEIAFVDPLVRTNETATFEWTVSESAQGLCSLDYLESVSCSEGSFTASNLAEGNHTLFIQLTDPYNNTANETLVFYVDLTPPITSFIDTPAIVSNQINSNFVFSCNELVGFCSFYCDFHSTASNTDTYELCGGNSYYTPSLENELEYVLSVYAIDSVGNIGNTVSHMWKVDLSPPVIEVNDTSITCSSYVEGNIPSVIVIDNIDENPVLTFRDEEGLCNVTRIWDARDESGNTATVIQHITILFTPIIELLPHISIACSSTSDENLVIPVNTASAPNICDKPLTLSHEDSTNTRTCPGQISRTWTLTDFCSGEEISTPQIISYYDTCPLEACGQHHSPPHGVCSLGVCLCIQPWYGDSCSITIYEPKIEPIEPQTLLEYQHYVANVSILQGAPPFTWNLVSGPSRARLLSSSQKLLLFRAEAGNLTFVIRARNQVGEDEIVVNAIVHPTYSVQLNALNQTQFSSNELIPLSGTVSHQSESPIREVLQGRVPVTIYIENLSFGWSRRINIFTDEYGFFSFPYNPGYSVYGNFTASATHPSQTKGAPQIEWGILGMKTLKKTLILDGETNGQYHNVFANETILINDGPYALHAIQALPLQQQVIDFGINVNVTFDESQKVLPTLDTGDQVPINVELETSGPVQGSFSLAIDTEEGVRISIRFDMHIKQILPLFHIEPSRIETSVTRGRQRSIDILITNSGKISAEGLHISLPDSPLFSLSSFGVGSNNDGNTNTLASQETAGASILITIPEEQSLGKINGELYVSSEETNSMVPFTIHVTSDSTMNLTIIVEDEYTYFAEGNPLVSDAIIILSNRRQNLQIMKSTSENNGSTTFVSIQEDAYDISVEAPDHKSIQNTIVTSISNPAVKIFLERETVKVSWSVIETEIEDTYDITIEVDYQVNVPMPVVTITPNEVDLEIYKLGLENSIEFNVTNHGLIRADCLNLHFPTDHPSLEFNILGDVPEHIEAKQVIIITVQVTPRRCQIIAAQCTLFYACLEYCYVCGEKQFRSVIVVLKESYTGDCFATGRLTSSPSSSVSLSSGPGSGSGSGFALIQVYESTTVNFCDECLHALSQCIEFKKMFGKLFGKNFRRRKQNSHSSNGEDCDDGFHGISRCAVEAGHIYIQNIILGALSHIECVGDNIIFPHFACIDEIVIECVLKRLPSYHQYHPSNIIKREVALDIVGNRIGNFAMTLLGFVKSVQLLEEIFGSEKWLLHGNQTWVQNVLSPVFQDSSELEHFVSPNELQIIRNSEYPTNITWNDIQKLIYRLNTTLTNWNSGILEPSTEHMDVISYSFVQQTLSNITMSNDLAKERGFDSYIDAYNNDYDAACEIDGLEENDGICAIVKIQVKQRIVLTREGFIGTLDIENLESKALENIEVEIIITDSDTLEVATEKFSIGTPTLSGALIGVSGDGVLPEGSSGIATWLVIPYSEAAPTMPILYDIGGKLSYTIDGSVIDLLFVPTTITVAPDPSLIVHYFWEKYVISDDPFTDEVEPPVPFSLGVLIKNVGFGTANSLNITSSQPEIIENDKGLLIEFEMISSMLGNEEITPSLAVTFGDITPNATATARWWMTASLMGKFLRYHATFENENPLGDPKLSLIDALVIHELIQNVLIPGEDEDDILDFLVNDDGDLNSYPDTIYSSKDMLTSHVELGNVTGLTVGEIGEITQLLVVTETSKSGWHYFVIKDERLDNLPTGSSHRISIQENRSTRSTAGLLPNTNAWISVEATNSRRRKSLNLLVYSAIDSRTSYLVDICENCALPNTSTPLVPANTADTISINRTEPLIPNTIESQISSPEPEQSQNMAVSAQRVFIKILSRTLRKKAVS